MNYFEWFGIPVSFLPDEKLIRKKYIEFSRRFHPDYFSNALPGEQQEALHKSTFNTRAYETLTDFRSRMKYILEEKKLLKEGEKNKLPAYFLMQMLEFNERIEVMKQTNSPILLSQLRNELHSMQKETDDEIKPCLANYSEVDESGLPEILDYYLRKQYLLRIEESLNSFSADP